MRDVPDICNSLLNQAGASEAEKISQSWCAWKALAPKLWTLNRPIFFDLPQPAPLQMYLQCARCISRYCNVVSSLFHQSSLCRDQPSSSSPWSSEEDWICEDGKSSKQTIQGYDLRQFSIQYCIQLKDVESCSIVLLQTCYQQVPSGGDETAKYTVSTSSSAHAHRSFSALTEMETLFPVGALFQKNELLHNIFLNWATIVWGNLILVRPVSNVQGSTWILSEVFLK